jgi:hypothetical protein
MTKFLVTTASTLAFACTAFAADMPTRQPPPLAPVVGKAPIPIIGKLPVVGKAPFGKSPPPPPPVVARGLIGPAACRRDDNFVTPSINALARRPTGVLAPPASLAAADKTTARPESKAEFVESPRGISPPGAPRTVHDPLESHGSRCSAVAMA